MQVGLVTAPSRRCQVVWRFPGHVCDLENAKQPGNVLRVQLVHKHDLSLAILRLIKRLHVIATGADLPRLARLHVTCCCPVPRRCPRFASLAKNSPNTPGRPPSWAVGMKQCWSAMLLQGPPTTALGLHMVAALHQHHSR